MSDDEPQHVPGDWRLETYSSFYKITDEQGVTIADIPVQPLDPEHWAEGNARMILRAPQLLTALERAFELLEGIADKLLYEEGQPVTFLESREIEDIYNDAICELAPFETLIREARRLQ